ncbi:MAG: hypothetical protein ACI978_002373 [Oleispira sp.]|jgi:hypothetical protein
MSTKYSCTVKNDSTQSGDFCIFQEVPDVNIPNIVTLAWLAKAANPTTTLKFDWSLDYSFIWSNTTNLQPGTKVEASQSWPCDTTTRNRINLDKVNNAYTFDAPTQGDYHGNLYIDQGQSVESKQVSVGIGMSGKGTFLAPSQPNMQLCFTPKPSYWLVFGSFVEGEVVDIAQVTENAIKLDYKGVTDLSVTLGADNTFSLN